MSIASAAGRKAAWRATEAAILTIHKNPQTAVFTVTWYQAQLGRTGGV